MTAMYVANPTAQQNLFCYTVPENPKVIQQEIPAGGQVRLLANGGNLNQHDIDAIVRHHRPYGMIPVDEVGKRGMTSFHGLVYSLDKPVSMVKLRELIQHNRAVLVEQGRINRQNAAVAVNDRLQQQINESGRGDVLRELVMEVEERTQTRPSSDQRNKQIDAMERDLAENLPFVGNTGRARTDEGIRVTTEVRPDSQPPRRRSRRRAAA
jgi:hypothetical protein